MQVRSLVLFWQLQEGEATSKDQSLPGWSRLELLWKGGTSPRQGDLASLSATEGSSGS